MKLFHFWCSSQKTKRWSDSAMKTEILDEKNMLLELFLYNLSSFFQLKQKEKNRRKSLLVTFYQILLESLSKTLTYIGKENVLGNRQSTHLYYCETWEYKKTKEKSHSNFWKLFFLYAVFMTAWIRKDLDNTKCYSSRFFIGKMTHIVSMLLNGILSFNLLNRKKKEYPYQGSNVMKPKRKSSDFFFHMCL